MEKDVLKRIDHKSIFPIVKPHEIPAYEMLRNKKQVELLPKIAPLCEEDIRVLKENGYEFPFNWQENNTLLIRNPFRPYQFIPVDTDQNTLISGHLHDVAAIFRALGATSCVENANIVSKEEISLKGKGKLTVKAIEIIGKIYYHIKQKQDVNIVLNIEDEKSTLSTEEKYNKAKSHAEKYHIEEVPQIKEILRFFDPKIGKTPKSYTYEEDLTTDLHTLFKGAIKVSSTGLFSLEGKMSYESKLFNNLHISKKITFQ